MAGSPPSPRTANWISARRCPCSCWTTRIAYHERTAGQHYENLKNGSPLVIAFANLEKKQGYRFRGNVVLHVDDDIYNEQVKVAEEKGTKKPAVIPVLEVTEIQDLASGPTAGKTIAKD